MLTDTLRTSPRARRIGRIFAWAAAVLLAGGSALAEGTNTYRFTNNEGAKAHDLHIEFDQAVSWNTTDPTYGWQDPKATFKSALGSGTTTVNLAEGVGGLGVANGDSLDLTFGFTGGDFPHVNKWWWTKEDGSVLGKQKFPPKKSIKFEYVSAQGGGMYEVIAHGERMLFQTLPGEPSTFAAMRLAQQINSQLRWGRANPRPEEALVVFQGTAFGPPCTDFAVNVLRQDRAGPLTVTSTLKCPADLNGDGLVDFADYLEFLNLFDEGSPSVDFNQDGLVDFVDYLEFLNLYEEGCPQEEPPCGM